MPQVVQRTPGSHPPEPDAHEENTSALTPDQIVEVLPANLVPENAGNTNALVQFNLSGRWAVSGG
ncbi:MAG TPA: hypothetical protein VGS16_11225 [Candidatus Dormibacteraeota bacterium]|nr:hypothetical protein [Candidatus Dormibacteraeota bacterium]